MQPAEILCPNCGAEPGDPCAGTHTFHAERVDAAEVTHAYKTRKRVNSEKAVSPKESAFESQQSER